MIRYEYKDGNRVWWRMEAELHTKSRFVSIPVDDPADEAEYVYDTWEVVVTRDNVHFVTVYVDVGEGDEPDVGHIANAVAVYCNAAMLGFVQYGQKK